jgi:hypothetical protein
MRDSLKGARCIREFWLRRARIVQLQGKNIGQLLGNYRQVCKTVDCSPAGDDAGPAYVGRVRFPKVGALVGFKGDHDTLPPHIREVTSLHVGYIPGVGPQEAVSANTVAKLVDQLVDIAERLRQKEDRDQLSGWVAASLVAASCSAPPGNVGMDAVKSVRRQLRGLVGVPIDKNRLLFFEDVSAYRQRLISTFIEDTKHYQPVARSEGVVLAECLATFDERKWAQFMPFNPKGRLGFAQCLPKDKDCSLSRPIVPNCSHPMGRLYNMAARGWAYVLRNLRLTHYNLFTTQQFVQQLACISPVVADMIGTGQASGAVIAQSDVKDMYTEISHADIDRCVAAVFDAWTQSGGAPVLCITKSGRCGVSTGRTRDTRQAVTMPLSTVRDIMLFELHNAYFRVGKAHILHQGMGVSMGSSGGPVVAWNVCMVSEAKFHATLGADERFIKVYRYFDDVWQLLIEPTGAGVSWVDDAVRSLQHQCYPASLRLILNSVAQSAEMLSCITRVGGDGVIHCLHRCKNAASWLSQGKPRFANFIPYASAHAHRRRVMRTSVLGMLHRIYMDTLPEDVPRLMPVLLCYACDLMHVGYPPDFLYQVFGAFMRHPKVRDSRQWWLLHAEYGQVSQCLRVTRVLK